MPILRAEVPELVALTHLVRVRARVKVGIRVRVSPGDCRTRALGQV